MYAFFCRRGSNVSLVLDMSALGSVEPLNCGVNTPRERVAQEYLQSASRVLTRQQLKEATLNTPALHAEFAVSQIIIQLHIRMCVRSSRQDTEMLSFIYSLFLWACTDLFWYSRILP